MPPSKATSARFTDLEKRVRDLRLHLLPRVPKGTLTYTPRQQDQTLGYVLLVHAEIEAYIEDRARNVANEALNRWQSHNDATRTLSSLLVFHQLESGSKGNLRSLTNDSVRKAFKYFISSVVEVNHGIREKNLLRLLLPIGMRHAEFPVLLLPTIESFGVLRGSVAHRSFKTIQPLDPAIQRATVENQILPHLKDLDKAINRYP